MGEGKLIVLAVIVATLLGSADLFVASFGHKPEAVAQTKTVIAQKTISPTPSVSAPTTAVRIPVLTPTLTPVKTQSVNNTNTASSQSSSNTSSQSPSSSSSSNSVNTTSSNQTLTNTSTPTVAPTAQPTAVPTPTPTQVSTQNVGFVLDRTSVSFSMGQYAEMGGVITLTQTSATSYSIDPLAGTLGGFALVPDNTSSSLTSGERIIFTLKTYGPSIGLHNGTLTFRNPANNQSISVPISITITN